MTHWVQTFHGKRLNVPSAGGFDLLAGRPRLNDFNVDVIDAHEVAHVLSMLPRFGGRTPRPYNVAQHSVYVAHLVAYWGGTLEEQWWAINHEGDEVLLGFDPPSPVIRACPQLAALKRAAMAAYCRRFGLPESTPDIVKRADLTMLVTEKRDLMAPEPEPWGVDAEPLTDLSALGLPSRTKSLNEDLWGQPYARDEYLYVWAKLYRQMRERNAEHPSNLCPQL